MLNFFKSLFGGEKGKRTRLWLLLAVAVVGILLLLAGGMVKSARNTEKAPSYDLNTDELIAYQKHLEGEIRTLCESVKGVGDVTVAITLSGGFEAVYATEWKGENEEYVILGSGSSAQALYLTRATPRLEGIGIVCHGGGNESIRNVLIPLLAATFNISSHRIYIAEAS